MKKLTILVMICTIASLSDASEQYDTKAFRIVQKLCYSCHGTAFYLAKQVDDDDWEFYFNTPNKLQKIHKNQPKAIKVFNSKRFKEKRKRLLKFFIKNSKFSGSVRGCDANFCGTHH